jgi:serine/threonine-protein kinase
VGAGASGEVWLARHRVLGSRVAIKVLKPRGGDDKQEWFRRRFLTEARILAQLESRHVVRVFDFGTTDDGLAYLAMEYLDGETLAARLRRRGKLPPAIIGLLLGQAARGLAKAHAAGVVHRDFKPDNVMLVTEDDGGTVAKVLDFGGARLSRESAARIRLLVGGDGDVAASSALVAGTPYYMAPEQTRRGVIDAATDQWAFGVVVYQCATGVLPFTGAGTPEVIEAIRRGYFVPPSKRVPSLPAALDAWMRVALHPDPEKRFGNMLACADALVLAVGDGAASRTTPARSVRPPAAAPLVVTGLALLASALIALQPAPHVHESAPERTSTLVPAAPAPLDPVVSLPPDRAPAPPSFHNPDPPVIPRMRSTSVVVPASYRGDPY